MKNIYHILSEEEKYIIEDKFIFNRDKSKQVYMKWRHSLFQKYNITEINDSRTNDTYRIELIWNNETKMNFVQYLFSHNQFVCSNNKLESLSVLNLNWQHTDNHNNNLLHYASKNNFYWIDTLVEKYHIDREIINNSGESFHTLVCINFNCAILTHTEQKFIMPIYRFPETMNNIMDHFIAKNMIDFITPEKIKLFVEKSELIIQGLHHYMHVNKIQDGTVDLLDSLSTKINYLNISQQLVDKTEVKNRMKI